MNEDRRLHDRIDKVDKSVEKMEGAMNTLHLTLSEHTFYIQKSAEFTKKNSEDIDILKEDLRVNKELNARTASASEESSKDLKELLKIFNGSKNMATSVKYFGLMAATVTAIIGSIVTIWHFGGEIVHHIFTFFRGW